MRQLGKDDTRMIAQTSLQQGLDALGRAPLQDVDIDACIEQELRSPNPLLGHERKRLVGSAVETYRPPPGLEPPERPFEIKTQDPGPAARALPVQSAFDRNRLPTRPERARIRATRCRT